MLEESSAIPRERAILDGVFPCREDSTSTSFKKAELALTNYSLKYTRPHESPIMMPMRSCVRSVARITSDGRSIFLAEHLEQTAFDKKHCVQLFSTNVPTLYIQFPSHAEAHEWLQACNEAFPLFPLTATRRPSALAVRSAAL